MKIRITRPYKDILLNRYTKINEILEVTPQRYKELQERIPTFIEVVETSTIEYEEPIRETQALPRACITNTKKKAVKKK